MPAPKATPEPRGPGRDPDRPHHDLTEHFKTHAKDNHSRRGLLMMVNKRRSLLDYLSKTEGERHPDLIAKLGLRK